MKSVFFLIRCVNIKINKNGQTKMGRNKLSFFQRHKYVKRNDLCYTRSSDSEYLF
jgi:hypothetical protein